MTKGIRPTYREMTSEEARAFLAAQHVGRLAFTQHNRVDVEPIHYVAEGDWIFGRTSAGSKLTTLLHHPWCALETDQVRGQFDWSSVVVKGTFYLLDSETGPPDVHRRAEQLLAELVPGSFTAHDPAPHRVIVFGIYIHEITGREAVR